MIKSLSFSRRRSTAQPMSFDSACNRALMKGQLKKQGKISHNWLTREFVLVCDDSDKGGSLYYYSTQEDPEPVGTIVVDHGCSVIPQSKDTLHGFILVTPHRSFNFFATSIRDASRWIAALENVINALSSKPQLPASPHSAQPRMREPQVRNTTNITSFYELKEVLGEGGNSVVRRGVNLVSAEEVALKIISRAKYKSNKKRIDEEIMIMGSLQHKNVLQLHEVIYTKDSLVLSMELLVGSELFARIVSREQYTENDAKKVTTEILEAVNYMHQNGIVHCDLKPENLIFDRPGDDATLKVVDFGLSGVLERGGKLKRYCGTPQYTAPEMLQRQPYDQAVDMWSVGVILYVLLCGYPPFYAANDTLLAQKIVNGQYQFHEQHWGRISDEAKDLIRKLLQVNPRSRLTSRQSLAHPWLQYKPSASMENLNDVLIQLKRYRALHGFRVLVHLMMAVNSMVALGPKT